MSRTYRKRKGKEFWYTEDEALAIRMGAWGEWSYFDSKEEYLADLRRFHTDAYDMQTPDKEFRRYHGHKHDRAATRICIKTEIKAVDRGEVMFPKKRNIDWLWD